MPAWTVATPIWLSSGQLGFFCSAAPERLAGLGDRLSAGSRGRPSASPSPRRQGDVDAFQLLLAVRRG